MKMNLIGIVALGTGVILLYSGVMGYDPRDVLKWGMGGKKPTKLGGSIIDNIAGGIAGVLPSDTGTGNTTTTKPTSPILSV